MLRGALLRGAASGFSVSIAGLVKIAETSTNEQGYYGPVIAVAIISGVTTVIVALVYVLLPRLLDRDRKKPAYRESHDEAVDALVGELARKERELQKAHERERRLQRDLERLRAEGDQAP